MTKLPEGHSLGYFFNIATGKQLDIHGEYEGIKRRTWFVFREPDYIYKKRIITAAIDKMDKTSQGRP